MMLGDRSGIAVDATPEAEAAQSAAAAPASSVWQWLRLLLRPHRAALAATFLLMLAQSATSLVHPWLAGQFAGAILDHVAVRHLLGFWFAMIVLQGLLNYAVNVRIETTGARLATDAGVRVFERLQVLPLGWHQGRNRGDVLSLLLRDVDFIARFVTSTLVPLLPLVLTCIGALMMMLRIQVWFALAAALLVPAAYVVMRASGRYLRPLGQAATDAYVARNTTVERSLSLLPIVKAFTGEKRETQRYRDRAVALQDLDIRVARIDAAVAPAVRAVAALLILALLWVASRQLASGTLSAADLTSLLLYGLLLTQPVSALAATYGRAHTAYAVVQRLRDLFTAAPEPAGGVHRPAEVRGAVAFERVDFTWPGQPPLLRQLELHVAAGEVVAITGTNGAGKSTLVQLLFRFVDPDGGRITLDGRELGDFPLSFLRRQIGVVPQKTILFDATIAANIAYGREGADAAAVMAAARVAQAHDFITALPDGYATRIGDDGVRLSGGQRQRLALARALLRDPAVLVLDEATSMFDPAAEEAFVQTYRAADRRRTLLLITHRPASLALADRVLRLQDGRLRDGHA